MSLDPPERNPLLKCLNPFILQLYLISWRRNPHCKVFTVVWSNKLMTLKIKATAINFTLPSGLTFKYKSEYTKYSREAKKSFLIYWIAWNHITINQIFMDLTKSKQIFEKGQKTEIELFIISHYFLMYTVFYLMYLQICHLCFAQCVQFVWLMMMKLINYSFNFEKLGKIRHYLTAI
jgi:hypothetical protein